MHASADAPSASSRHWCLVLNGKAAGNDELRAAVHAMRAQGVHLDVRVTWESGDVQGIVEHALDDGVDTIIAAGGDGTVGRVAGWLARHDRDADALPALGVVPLGTANDFAVAAGIPIAPLDALQLMRDCPAHPVDLMRVRANDHIAWCVNLASGGFGTRITTETNETLKKQIGGLAYLLTGMSRLGEVGPVEAHVQGRTADGGVFSYDGAFIALGIGNARQAGGGHMLCPDALIDDGLLDLTIIEPLEGNLGATLGTLVTEGRQAAIERVALRARLRALDIRAREPIVLNLDGEPLESTHFAVDCVPGRLRMHLPHGCALLASHA